MTISQRITSAPVGIYNAFVVEGSETYIVELGLDRHYCLFDLRSEVRQRVYMMQMFKSYEEVNEHSSFLITNPSVFWSDRSYFAKEYEHIRYYVPMFVRPQYRNNIMGIGKPANLYAPFRHYLDPAYEGVEPRMIVKPVVWDEDKRLYWITKRHTAHNAKFAYSTNSQFPFTCPIPIYDYLP